MKKDFDFWMRQTLREKSADILQSWKQEREERSMITMKMYALMFIGTHYTWGGNTAEQGFDCSGFIQEVMRSTYPYKGDRTAQQLYEYMKDNELFDTEEIFNIYEADQDCIAFYGKDERSITHIAMCLGNFQIIEAGGEGRVPTDKGSVRVRSIHDRNDYVKILRII